MKQSSEADRRSPEGERRSPSSEDEKEDKESSAEITNHEDFKEIFQPRSVICKTDFQCITMHLILVAQNVKS